MAPVSPSALVCVGGGRQIEVRGDGISAPLLERKWNWAVDAKRMIRKEGSRVQAAGGPGGQTLNLSMPAAPFFFRGLRPRMGMRPGLVETELSFAGLTALVQGGM